MQVGDIILKVNETDTVNVEHIIAVNALKSAGEEVNLVNLYFVSFFFFFNFYLNNKSFGLKHNIVFLKFLLAKSETFLLLEN